MNWLKGHTNLWAQQKKFCNKDPVWQLSRAFFASSHARHFFKTFKKAGNKMKFINFDDIWFTNNDGAFMKIKRRHSALWNDHNSGGKTGNRWVVKSSDVGITDFPTVKSQMDRRRKISMQPISSWALISPKLFLGLIHSMPLVATFNMHQEAYLWYNLLMIYIEGSFPIWYFDWPENIVPKQDIDFTR